MKKGLVSLSVLFSLVFVMGGCAEMGKALSTEKDKSVQAQSKAVMNAVKTEAKKCAEQKIALKACDSLPETGQEACKTQAKASMGSNCHGM